MASSNEDEKRVCDMLEIERRERVIQGEMRAMERKTREETERINLLMRSHSIYPVYGGM